MRVLVACEFSGIVRDAFITRGHDAWSCDLVPSERPGPHFTGDILELLNESWDMMIAFPPCTYLCQVSTIRMSDPGHKEKAIKAMGFVSRLWDAPISKIAIENPRGLLNRWWRKSDQTIHPYHFGGDYWKATCLWLKNLPPLMASVVVANPQKNWVNRGDFSDRGEERRKARSRTYAGVAEAMAAQWGSVHDRSKQ